MINIYTYIYIVYVANHWLFISEKGQPHFLRMAGVSNQLSTAGFCKYSFMDREQNQILRDNVTNFICVNGVILQWISVNSPLLDSVSFKC